MLPNIEYDVKVRFASTEYFDALLERVAKVSASSGNKGREILNLAMKEAVIAGYIKTNPVTGTKPYKRLKPKVTILSKEKIKVLLKAASENNWYLEILLGLFCGLRKGEILGLKFSDFDFAENPATGINLPKTVKKTEYRTRNIDTQKTLTMDQILILLEASRETPIYMQVLFNVLMGLRRSEIIGVKYSDIDYVNRVFKLRRQLGEKINTKKEDFAPKTLTKQELELKTPSSYRDIPIPDYVFEAILEQREVYERNRRRRRSQFQDSGYICCSSYGKPRSKDFHWKYYKKLLADNQLPDIGWHHLRSTFCTQLLKNNFNPKAISILLGHATELITLDIYGDNQEIIADCVDEIQPFIDEVLPVKEDDEKMKQELLEISIPVEEYL